MLFCQKGSHLHTELRTAWKLYVASDKATVAKYSHLFTAPQEQAMPFVAFQQTVLRERITTIAAEELSEVERYISEHFLKQRELEDCPWKALEVDGSESQLDLQRQYVEE